MSRLTNKEYLEWCEEEDICSISENADYLTKCYQKLGQLEDLEEELGIDFIILFKALKNGVYLKYPNSDYIFCPRVEMFRLEERDELWFFAEDEQKTSRPIKFNWYKYRWALTKEELNDKN